MSSPTLGWLLAAVVGLVGCYIEPVEETGCQDATFRLTCRQLDDRIAILEASFTSNWTAALLDAPSPAADNNNSSSSLRCEEGSSWSWDGDGGAMPSPATAGPFDIRPSVNYRCSGMNHCSFILTADHKPSADWGPGVVNLRYACFNKDHMTKFCNEEITVKDEGFVMSPGYPGYYVHQNDCYWLLRAATGQRLQLSLLDMSLRGFGEPGANCTDRLQVSEDDRVLLTECGELDRAAIVVSEGNVLNVSLNGLTQNVFPKRGILFHYKALGCPVLTPPADGYTVYKNKTDAQFMCCVDYVFPDTMQRVRDLHCVNGNTWSTSLPNCTNSTMQTLGRGSNPPPTVVPVPSAANMNNLHTAAIIKESDFILDVILPTMIICILIIGNGVILFVIFYLRKRKAPDSGDEEELGDIYQPNDGSISDKEINV